MKNDLLKKMNRISKDLFSSHEAIKAGLTYYTLKQLVTEGHLTKVGRGIFSKQRSAHTEHEHYAIALAKLGEPSALCLWSALVFHDLTEEAPSEILAYVPYEKTTRQKIKAIRKRNPKWNIGIETINGIRVTTIERTLIDIILDRKHFSEVQAFKIVVDAVRNKKTTFKKIYQMAKKLKVDTKLKRDLMMLEEAYV